MKDIETEQEFFSAISDTDKVVVADFFATWCGPCTKMSVILPNLEKEIANEAEIVKVDYDKLNTLANIYEVTKVPTFIFFKDGQEKARFEGVKLLKEIKEQALSL